VEKQEEYEALQVPEYWIVDYRGQIPAKYCQRGKGKKVIVLTLEDGVYRKAEYVEGESGAVSDVSGVGVDGGADFGG
jgi:Uma2 family endonuclease